MSYKNFISEVIKRSKQPLPENASYEFEGRFLNFDRKSFETLRNKLKDMSNNPAKKEWKPFSLSDYYDFIIDGKRYTSIPGENNLRMMEKIGILFKKENNIKFALSQEREEGLSPDIMFDGDKLRFLSDVKRVELKRKKKRTTFEVKNIKIDMTEVVQDEILKYEVELEIDPKYLSKQEQLFKQLVDIISKFVPRTEDIIQYFNFEMTNGTKDKNDDLIYGTISRARDLKIEDISYNGILKNYVASVKADGEYRFLVFHRTGIWLLYPKHIIKRLGDLSGDYPENTILAGELITKDKLKNKNMVIDAEEIFIPFDVTVIAGENVSRKKYNLRREYIIKFFKNDSYININGSNKLFIKHKQYFLINSIDTFYNVMEDVMKERETVFYKEDGFIITPDRSPYITSGASKQFPERILSLHSDICKWKPKEKLTVDFLYEFDGEHIIKTKNRDVIHFKGTPISKKFRFIELESIKNRSGSIVEFRPIEIIGDVVVLKPDRIREDKIFPNDYYIVENIYHLLMNPIEKETLLGKDTVLMRKFHNRLKRDLLNDVPKNSILIDIGSGKGGDITKWKKFSKVLAIEPNRNNVHEFEKRLKNYDLEDKVEILNTRGEDTDTIEENVKTFLPEDLEGNQVYISFMFSLSFFFENDTSIQSLSDTINKINEVVSERDGNKCEILFITLDGRRLKCLFEKLNNSKIPGLSNVDLNTISLSHKESENRLKISIKDSKTVSETQTEYFVFMDKLFEEINYFSPKTIYASNESKNLIMSEPEEIYSSLVIYGKAIYSEEKIVETPNTRLPVFLDIAIESNGSFYAKGDDRTQLMFHLGKNIFRIATINNGVSIVHSVLKLISKDYLAEDTQSRHTRAERFTERLDYDLSVDNISMVTGYKLNVIEQTSMRKFGEGKKSIFLYLNKDGTFEPLVKKINNTEYCSIFE